MRYLKLKESNKIKKLLQSVPLYAFFFVLLFCSSCSGQKKTELSTDHTQAESNETVYPEAPKSITRNIIQDRYGNIWIASFEGIIRYDGKSFTNITGQESISRFFSVLEDSKGSFWFASIGSGVYYYDGSSFQNFTTREGLASNVVTFIYEDKSGKIWFGTEGGASRYDGNHFQTFTTKEGLPDNDVSTIIEDKTGKFWFGTRDGVSIYDGEKFSNFTNNEGIPLLNGSDGLLHSGVKSFGNVRSIIEDEEGNIWLGGSDGLWRYNGSTFTNLAQQFVGYVYQDSEGKIWTSSQDANGKGWVLSYYDKQLHNQMSVNKIKSVDGMIFGILEADDGGIWFGTLNGVYRYDGNTFDDFKGK